MAQSDSEQPLFSGNLVWKLTDIGEQIYCEVLQKESELREQESGPMEDMFWKFPHIGEEIFKKLGNKNLAKCQKVGKTWGHFITNQRFYQQRVKYEKMQKNTDELMGMTPLHEAAGKGEFELCKQIINNVQNKNPKCHYGFTPLHLAAEEGHLSICQLILKNTKNKNPRSKNGKTPLHHAANKG